MATYEIKETYTDGYEYVDRFDIPDYIGTYQLKFTLEDGQECTGNVVVDTIPNTYNITATLTNGTVIDVATLETYYELVGPVVEAEIDEDAGKIIVRINNNNQKMTSTGIKYYAVKCDINGEVWEEGDGYGGWVVKTQMSTTMTTSSFLNTVRFPDTSVERITVTFYDDNHYQYTAKSVVPELPEEETTTT